MSSLYHSTHPIKKIPTQALPELGKRCFVIPGQGSAYPGMFDRYLASRKEFQEIFAFADKTASFHDLLPLSTYLLSPQSLPKEKTHIYRNCALFCVEVAVGRVLINEGMTPDSITGHSFGECAGLVLSGIISFEEMMSVVIYRNLLCPPAGELGVMITISAEFDKLSPLLEREGVYLANRNSHRQIVVSIRTDQKDATLKWLRETRTPHLILNGLPQPYHSPLMEPYRQELRLKLKDLSVTPCLPVYPFFSGIMHHWITEKNYKEVDFLDLLSKQFTEPVDFIQQLEEAFASGARRFYEVGPGKMLEPAIRGVLGERNILYREIEDKFALVSGVKEEVKSTANPNSPWFKKIKQIIQSVTGYADKDIQIGNSFQNDLGIDSLRKAEILVQLIKEQGLNTNSDFSVTRFSYIHEAVEYLEQYSEFSDPLRIDHEKKIELLTPRWTTAPIFEFGSCSLKDYYVYECSAHDFSWELLERVSRESLVQKKKALLILRNESGEEFNRYLPAKLRPGYDPSFIELESRPQIALIENFSEPSLAPLLAFLRSIAKESRAFELGYFSDPKKSLSNLEIAQSMSFSPSKDIRINDGRREVRELSPFQVETASPGPIRVLAIGGSKGIGLEILRRFPESARDSLLLVGRSAPEDESIQVQLKELKEKWPRFKYLQLDASHLHEESDILRSFFGEQIDLVINSAGTEISQAFEQRDSASIRAEISSKTNPFLSVETLAEKIKISKILHFTSVVSQFGNKGQAVYSWSNSWMEGNLGENSHAIAWAPWESVGMTSNEGILQKIKEWGISLVSPEEGAELTQELIWSKHTLPKIIVPMDQKDTLLFNLEFHMSSSLGKLINNFEAVFHKEIYLSDYPFLKDHVLLGHRLVPAAYFLAQFLSLSKAQFGRLTAIKNFNIENALIIEEDYCAYKLQCFQRSPYDLSVYSIIPHARGNFAPDSVCAERNWHNMDKERSVLIESFYNEEGFGEAFRFIKKAFVSSKNQLRVEVELSTIPVLTGDRFFDFWLYLLDTAFQSLSMHIKLFEHVASIPVRFGSLSFSQEASVTPVFSFYPVMRPDLADTADIYFVNSDGAVFCEMKEVVFRKHYDKVYNLLGFAEVD